jgi:hypothetical protein
MKISSSNIIYKSLSKARSSSPKQRGSFVPKQCIGKSNYGVIPHPSPPVRSDNEKDDKYHISDCKGNISPNNHDSLIRSNTTGSCSPYGYGKIGRSSLYSGFSPDCLSVINRGNTTSTSCFMDISKENSPSPSNQHLSLPSSLPSIQNQLNSNIQAAPILPVYSKHAFCSHQGQLVSISSLESRDSATHPSSFGVDSPADMSYSHSLCHTPISQSCIAAHARSMSPAVCDSSSPLHSSNSSQASCSVDLTHRSFHTHVLSTASESDRLHHIPNVSLSPKFIQTKSIFDTVRNEEWQKKVEQSNALFNEITNKKMEVWIIDFYMFLSIFKQSFGNKSNNVIPLQRRLSNVSNCVIMSGLRKWVEVFYFLL